MTDRPNPVTTTTYDPLYQTFPVQESVWLAHRGGTAAPPRRTTPVTAPAVPAAPTVTALRGTVRSLRVTWTAPATGGAAITHYELRYRVGSSGDWTPVSTVLGPVTAYEVQVRAWNALGASAWSPSGTATTAGLPASLAVGTGADGAAVFDGTTEVAGFTRSGTTYTATRSEPAVYNFTTITVEPNVTVTWPQGVSVWFKHTGRFWVKSDAVIDGNGKGFAGGAGVAPVNSRYARSGASGEGPGAGRGSSYGGSGAGHGGPGGGSSPGPPYGTADLAGAWTIQKAGSGGGGGGSDPGDDDSGGPLTRGGGGGGGGGAFRAAGHIQQIDGTIRCDGHGGGRARGGHEAASGGGGGSGGSILLEAVVLQGAGRLHCDGGAGGRANYSGHSSDRSNGGAGSGGRIRWNAPTPSNTITTSVLGPGHVADGTSTVGYLARPSTAPSPPLAPHVVVLATARLRVFWTAPPAGSAPITGYELQYRVGSSGTWTTVSATGSATYHDLAGLTAGTTYQVQLRAQNSVGWSAWSSSGSASTLPAPGTALTTTRAFDAGTGLVTQVTDPNGAVTRASYDTFGRLTQVIRPGDTTAAPSVAYTYTYGAAPNRLLAVTKDGSADGGRPRCSSMMGWAG